MKKSNPLHKRLSTLMRHWTVLISHLNNFKTTSDTTNSNFHNLRCQDSAISHLWIHLLQAEEMSWRALLREVSESENTLEVSREVVEQAYIVLARIIRKKTVSHLISS